MADLLVAVDTTIRMHPGETLMAARASGTVDVTMPATDAGSHVTVTAWLKHPGDAVEEHEALCVVDLGAGAAEVASPATGVLRMVTVAAGEQVLVGASLAVIDRG